MALGSNTYGTVDRVQALVGDLAEGRVFTVSTQPTLAEVETLLDDVASEIHSELAKFGYPILTNAVLTSDHAVAQTYFRNTNTVGAAAYILDTGSAEAVTPGDEQEGVQTRSQRLSSRYKRLLKLIDGPMLSELGLTRTRKQTDGLLVGSYQDSDGNVNKPFFKRGQFDFTGSRSLTES